MTRCDGTAADVAVGVAGRADVLRLQGTEAPVHVPNGNGNGNGGPNLSGLTTEQVSAVEAMIAAFRAT